MATKIEEFSTKLQEQLHLEQDLKPNDLGFYSLKISKKLTIQYQDLSPGLNLMSFLSSLPASNKESLLMTLMNIHLFGKGTHGGILGYDEEHHQLTLTQALPYELSYLEFKEAIEVFVNSAEFLQNELLKVVKGEPSLLIK